MPRASGSASTTSSRRATSPTSARRQAEITLQGAAVGTPDAFPHDLTRAEALLAAGRAADAEAALRQLEALFPASADAAEAQARRDRVQLRLAQAACAQRRCASGARHADRPRRHAAWVSVRRSTSWRPRCASRARPPSIARRSTPWPPSPRAPPPTCGSSVRSTSTARTCSRPTPTPRRRRPSAGCSIGIRRAATPSARPGSTAGASYRAGKFDEAVRVFELAAASIPRANTRPAWLYWSGRGREKAGDTARGHAATHARRGGLPALLLRPPRRPSR